MDLVVFDKNWMLLAVFSVVRMSVSRAARGPVERVVGMADGVCLSAQSTRL